MKLAHVELLLVGLVPSDDESVSEVLRVRRTVPHAELQGATCMQDRFTCGARPYKQFLDAECYTAAG
jgi:hypothetical protein